MPGATPVILVGDRVPGLLAAPHVARPWPRERPEEMHAPSGLSETERRCCDLFSRGSNAALLIEQKSHVGDGNEQAERPYDHAASELIGLAMPGGLDGADLTDTIRRDHPGIKAVLCSGFADCRKRVGESVPLLQKPYPAAELATLQRRAQRGKA